ncbi:MAG: carbohydrate-binding protein [Chloroflexi bacterium]|nr:carbohydrate-binding protein [Chloroflexota bacterium]
MRPNHLRTVAAVVVLLAMIALNLNVYPTYAAVGGRNLPANGKILFFMGQDSTTLTDYKNQVINGGFGAPQPGGVTLYTNLLLGGDPPAMAGMYGSANWGAGEVNFDTTLSQYPNAALAIGLYLSDSSTGCNNQPLRAIMGRNDADVTAGNPSLINQYRAKVDELINKLKSYNRQVFLRIGYEYDGPWNCYSADFYKEAFRYIKGRIDALGATQVATVWQSAAWPLNEHPDHPEWNYIVTTNDHFDVWYPGDAYVDWVGMSAFYNSGSVGTQWSCQATSIAPVELQNRILNFARARSKPVMIAEASPQGYSTSLLTKNCLFANAPTGTNASEIWSQWYAPFFAYIQANSDVIRAVAYINTNWESQTLWKCVGQPGGTGCPNGYWGDSRIQAQASIRTNFINELKKSIYVNGTGSPQPTATPNQPQPTATPNQPQPTATQPAGGRDAYARIEAESFNSQSGLQIVSSGVASAGAKVGYSNNGDWIKLSGVNFGSSRPQLVSLRYSSPRSVAYVLEVRLDSPTGPLLASPGMNGTGGWDAFQTINFNVSNGPTGTRDVYVVWKANDTGSIADLDWITFTR